MNTQREQEVTEAVDENRPRQAGIDEPQRLLDKGGDQVNQIRMQYVRQQRGQNGKQ